MNDEKIIPLAAKKICSVPTLETQIDYSYSAQKNIKAPPPRRVKYQDSSLMKLFLCQKRQIPETSSSLWQIQASCHPPPPPLSLTSASDLLERHLQPLPDEIPTPTPSELPVNRQSSNLYNGQIEVYRFCPFPLRHLFDDVLILEVELSAQLVNSYLKTGRMVQI
ncbi:thaumatin-like protein 1 isoform X1 [Gossypium australe]|uniref:Thaumatin-like protein 1 isoform X1 n=1 Tax=Gossypium australe TaxID=47621 RepID=A0A5B6VDN3_9ROSI|nr:thaumatin-like protein 1 isoform X1 [Gossypium australe]